MEWKNKYNTFNSMKTLVWRDTYETIAKGEIPKPVGVTLELNNTCNLNCRYCHIKNRTEHFMKEQDILQACDDIKKLGAVSCTLNCGCFTHPSIGITIRRLKDNTIHTGVITNGIYTERYLDDILYSLDWMGIHLDATVETYFSLKKGTTVDFFSVIHTIKTITRLRQNNHPLIYIKFFIYPENYHEIYDAAKLAKSIGADFIQIRPASIGKKIWFPEMIDEINRQITYALALETKTFKVYAVTHKYTEKFRKIILDKCEVTSLGGLTFAGDGNCYLCRDLIGEKQGYMCKWNEINDFWGSSTHKKLLQQLDPKKCPDECSYCSYQEILDNVFRANMMQYHFP